MRTKTKGSRTRRRREKKATEEDEEEEKKKKKRKKRERKRRKRGWKGKGQHYSTIVWRLWEKDLRLEERPLIRGRRDEKVAAFRRHGLKKHARTNSKPYHRQHRTASNKGGGRGEGGVWGALGSLGVYNPNLLFLRIRFPLSLCVCVCV